MDASRRTFLVAAAGIVAAGVATERATVWKKQRDVAAWSDALAAFPSAADLGLEYLTRQPTEADAPALRARFAALLPATALLGGREQIAAALDARIHADFLREDLVSLGGWLLARTTLRLCALVALAQAAQTGTVGVFAPQALPNGDLVHWTAPTCRLVLPAGASRLELRVRSGHADPQQVALRVDGRVVAEIFAPSGAWQRVGYPMRPSGRAVPLELVTHPAWTPANDFRTLGVGLDRVTL